MTADPKTYDYTNPTRSCDIVMKGGITSGVVYPHAVCELAQTYRFRNVGGTSAGAIAAAAAAAAEFGRTRGGFVKLASLPEWIGSGTNMLGMFQPQRRTRPLFRLLLALIARRRARFTRALVVALWSFPVAVLVGSAPGATLITVAVLEGDGLLFWVAFTAGVLLLIVGVPLALVAAALRRFARAVPDNGFGICSGMGSGVRPALTPWLADQIDRFAGADEPVGDRAPLTFGDLWTGPNGATDGEQRQWLRLEMMTTNLTNRRPERLPWSTEAYFFDPGQFRRLFPERVVKWMIEHPPPEPEADGDRRNRRLQMALMRPRCPFPSPRDLPVIVATRMSLSFPLLLSAVPLWTFDMSRKANQDALHAWREWASQYGVGWENVIGDVDGRKQLAAEFGEPEAEVCWFSDGGISSNFPIHFFDAPLPRWPTFAVNLRPFHPDHPRSNNEADNVWMPESNAGGILEWWYRFPQPKRFALRDGRVSAFGNAVVRTMQNRVDEAQMRMPGYRDRVVHIGHTKDEGGMNLTMEPADILRLTTRGRAAAELLIDRFAPSQSAHTLSWANHRWVRYRSTMAALEQLLRGIASGYSTAPEDLDDLPYASLVTRGGNSPPNSYRWLRQDQRDFAAEASAKIVELDQWAQSEGETFTEGAPSPAAEARIVPPR